MKEKKLYTCEIYNKDYADKLEEYRVAHNLPKIENYGMRVGHNPMSEDIYKFISEVDFANGDFFVFKSGGDGDSGEFLMSLLDEYFKDRTQNSCFKR